jgi:hypothetical protein
LQDIFFAEKLLHPVCIDVEVFKGFVHQKERCSHHRSDRFTNPTSESTNLNISTKDYSENPSSLIIEPTSVLHEKNYSEMDLFLTPVTTTPIFTSTRKITSTQKEQMKKLDARTTSVHKDGFLVFGRVKTTTQTSEDGSNATEKETMAGVHISWIILAVLLTAGSGFGCIISIIGSLICLDRLAWFNARCKVRKTVGSISSPVSL